jgi:hypothetical protein
MPGPSTPAPPSPALLKVQRTLQRRLTTLVETAQSDRTAGHATKLLGLTSLVLGGFAVVTAGGLAAVPLSVGAITYLASVLGQARKTGRVMLLPFNETGTSEMLAGLAQAEVVLPDLEDYRYMSATHKAEYAMILCCGQRLAQALVQLPTREHQQFVYLVAKRRFMELYGPHIQTTPELLFQVDAHEVASYLLAGEDDFQALRADLTQASMHPATDQAVAAFSEPSGGAEAGLGSQVSSEASIGPETRLNAMTVAVSSPGPGGRQATADGLSVAEDLAQPVQNSLIIGKPGSGKGMLLANALRAVQAQEPQRQIYVIDPKADPLEQPYWQGCDCVASKACAELMPLDIWDWVAELYPRVSTHPGAKAAGGDGAAVFVQHLCPD